MSGDVSSVIIHDVVAEKLNYAACQQRAFVFLRELRVENQGELGLDDAVLALSSNPVFFEPQTWPLDRVGPKSEVLIEGRDITLDAGLFRGLSESAQATFTIAVEKDGFELARKTRRIELLAYNEWGGTGYMPDLLAAFSMPNDPATSRILHDASMVLRKAGRSDAINGYQSGSRERVWEIASAIYTAIANLGITYAVPPASFEHNGQKIRLPSQIVEDRVATCLDTTMFFVSVLEQAGLNPIVALPQGHAVAGVWLQPEELASIVIDEAEPLRKRIDLKELVLIETTFVTSSPAPPFSKAVEAAREVIDPGRDDTFDSAADIRRARDGGIKPLGAERDGNVDLAGQKREEAGARVELTLETAPSLPDFDENFGERSDSLETPMDRLGRWKRKLLDLSARNPLLNHRSTQTSLTIICPDPASLEDKLASGKRVSIQSAQQLVGRDPDQETLLREQAMAALNQTRPQILVDLPKDELSKRTVQIYRKAQTALQEGGANTLYLSLGFLLWRRNEKDSRRFRAPLILLPVSLERTSVRSGVKMVAHDDEPRFNTTLLEMLRTDFDIDIPGLDGELPADESGIDVNDVWNRVRRAVLEAEGFEVVEDVALGHFSFAKYLMWKDLEDRADALRQSDVVRHLIDMPQETFQGSSGGFGTFVLGKDIDRNYQPSDLLAPLPADSSQMAAIATADRGTNFVIIGPPGTGKSQTISNLIAHLLGKDKTVLFVSEKTAALEVVYRRLEEIGLGRFCLELHSNKARKLDVLNQLRRSWERLEEIDEASLVKEATRLGELRDGLNRVVDRLHVPRRNGMTAFHAIGVKVKDEPLAKVALSWPSAESHDEDDLARLRKAVENLRIQFEAVGDVASSPFHAVTDHDWSPQWESAVIEHARGLVEAADVAEQSVGAFVDATGLSLSIPPGEHLNALAGLAQSLTESHGKQISWVLEPDGSDRIEDIGEAISRLRNYASAQEALSCTYDPMTWRKLDGDALARRWRESESAWWLKRFFIRRRIVKEMRAAGASTTPSQPVEDADALGVLRLHGEAIDQLDKHLSGLRHWQSHRTNPGSLQMLQTLGEQVRQCTAALADDMEKLAEVRKKIAFLLSEGNDLLAVDGSVGKVAGELVASYQQWQAACKAADSIEIRSKTMDAARSNARQIIEHRAGLRNWSNWRQRRREAVESGLGALVDAMVGGQVSADQIESTFEAAYCTWFSRAIMGEDKVLRTFSTAEHVASIEKFCTADDHFRDLTTKFIAAKLSGNLPAQDDVKRSSSWGILRRELQKQRRHKPVRQLVKEIPDALTALAPCLMMSPLSVAQYLPAEQQLFDVVIFDEASQITTWDAVGSLARGRQAIVAGDQKQMPPTNFFARSDDDLDGDMDQGDLESILDEMLGANIPLQTLNLHYRSRRESLIAFSNSHYYENRLVTFPAPIHPDNGVRLVRVDGFYARGGARHNEGEAKAIVAEIVRRLNDPEEKKKSIGVVTFNVEQQSLIETLLDEERARDPSIEWAFSVDRTEPVFVKNLETVQGDERDVILFSITYGPDRTGHITMQFGPLNRDGGERRLNVAMTRARWEMVVFSTLDPKKIDLSRTQARAVADLKHFIEYAHRGASALATAVHGPLGDFESPFESAVALGLKENGWEVHPQVGVSAYRIDLGIVHPDAPGSYLAGVECDGRMYHSSANARERDKIRQSVLEGLGWTLFRIWSTDWWNHRGESLRKLDKALKDHLEAERQLISSRQ